MEPNDLEVRDAIRHLLSQVLDGGEHIWDAWVLPNTPHQEVVKARDKLLAFLISKEITRADIRVCMYLTLLWGGLEEKVAGRNSDATGTLQMRAAKLMLVKAVQSLYPKAPPPNGEPTELPQGPEAEPATEVPGKSSSTTGDLEDQ